MDVLLTILHSIRLFVELLSMLATRQKKWYRHLQQVQSLIHQNDYIQLLNVNKVVQQSVLADPCCFHRSFGASTAVGPYVVQRNRKRLLLSQSTLREGFVDKKYLAFDIIGRLLILVQVNPLS